MADGIPGQASPMRGCGLRIWGDVRDHGRMCRWCGKPVGVGPANKVYCCAAHEKAAREERNAKR